MTPREVLRRYAEALPAGTAVPVLREMILELLGDDASDPTAPTGPQADFTVAEVAKQFSRRPATVRGWCEAGAFPGAYHFRGKEWRIPQVAIEAFIAGERQRTPGKPQPRRVSRALDRVMRSGRR